MADAEDGGDSLISRRGLPVLLFGLAALVLVVSFFVGWYSVDARVDRWGLDETAADRKGPPLTPHTFRLDLEMHVHTIKMQVGPSSLEEQIAPVGPPTYEEHAGNMGTVMLGVLMLQVAVAVSFLAGGVFYLVNRRNATGRLASTIRRFLVLYIILVLTTMGYFALRIGPSAEDDETYILESYRFHDETLYGDVAPQLAFWQTWRKTMVVFNEANDDDELWQFTVESRPSAGWWLEIAALGLVIAGFFLARSNGEFQQRSAILPQPPALPKSWSG